jgi:transcriptional regulator GlxA family with amidase domain
LLLTQKADAARVAFEVGYESASQFNREYRRLFGAPPVRDITRARRALASAKDGNLQVRVTSRLTIESHENP